MARKGVSCDFCDVLIRPEDFESGEAVILLKRHYCPRCMAAAVKRSKLKRSAAAVALQTPPPAPMVRARSSGRRHERKDCSIAVELSVYLESGQLWDRGQAVLWNVSLSGALLRALLLPAKTLPAVPHKIGIRVLEGPLLGFQILARPVRLAHTEDGLHLAVEFVRLEEAQLRQLRKLL